MQQSKSTRALRVAEREADPVLKADSFATKLMKKMGWKEGQGLGRSMFIIVFAFSAVV